MSGDVRHLYVHLPFCAHRCGYCDFVTAVGRVGEHGAYADALLAELDRERWRLASDVETVFVGGGTPTFTEPGALGRVLAALPDAGELTVEANPETVTPELAVLLREHGVTRVSVGAQSFRPDLLEVLERVAGPDDIRRAVHTLRDAGFDNISLDLIYGIPGQSPADLEADLADALALEPEHLSCYELEAKTGTRFTHAHGDGARPPGGGDGGLRRTRRGDADRCGLPLVRDGELLPKRPRPRAPRAAQPGDLARCRLPRRRGRGGVDAGRRAAPEPAIGRALRGGARGRRGSAARRRAARRGDTRPSSG